MINPERKKLVEEVVSELNKEYPEYTFTCIEYLPNEFNRLGMVWGVYQRNPEFNGSFQGMDDYELNEGYSQDLKTYIKSNLIKMKDDLHVDLFSLIKEGIKNDKSRKRTNS